MKLIKNIEKEIKLKGKKVYLPIPSIGNVGQLTIDLLITTLKAEKIGYFYSSLVYPVVGNDAYYNSKGELSTSFELYQYEEDYFIQIRSPIKDLKKFSISFINWFKENELSKLILLSSGILLLYLKI
jgi:proteasome assembly chaperone 2